jgi:cellulose biosynthesis protein BcsQ
VAILELASIFLHFCPVSELHSAILKLRFWHADSGGMNTICLYCRKGGVGKTSMSLDLAVLAGSRVLLVDADPQCSLSGLLLGGDSEVVAIPRERTIASAFEGRVVEPLQVRDNVWLVPGNHQVKASSSLCLPSGFETAVIDTGPSFADGIVRAILTKSDLCLVPATPEPMTVQAVGAAMEMFASVAAVTNPGLRHLGVVLTQVRRGIAIHQAVERLIRGMYGDRVLSTVLPQAAAVSEASGLGKSVLEVHPRSPSSIALRRLVDEIGERLEMEGRRAA